MFLEELTRSGRALAGHLVGLDLAAPVVADRPPVQRADVEHGTGFGVEVYRAAGVGGHGVEVTGVEVELSPSPVVAT